MPPQFVGCFHGQALAVGLKDFGRDADEQIPGQAQRPVFPESFRLVLRSYLKANPKNRYLFESQRCLPFTPRRVQQLVQAYRNQAGIAQHVHPQLSLLIITLEY